MELFIAILVLVIIIVIPNIKIVPQAKAYVIERLGSYYTTYEQNASGWFENGCLCKIEPDYLNDPDKANWQHGFTVVNSYDGINQATQILIQDGKFAYGDRIYK